MRGLALLALGAIGVAVIVTLTQDPERSWAVGVVIVALGCAAGALATLAQLRIASGRHRRQQRRAIATRRGVEIGAMVGALLWLRAIDGLSVLTAVFVIGSFFVAEAILSAQARSPR